MRFVLSWERRDYCTPVYTDFFSFGSLSAFAHDFLLRYPENGASSHSHLGAQELLEALRFRATKGWPERRSAEHAAFFTTYAWRAHKHFHLPAQTPDRAKDREKALLAIVRTRSVVSPLFEDHQIRFHFHSGRGDIPLPRGEEDFALAWQRWWLMDEDALRPVVTNAWRWLYTGGALSPTHRYELATNLITAMDQPAMQEVRGDEEISWHYCFWHKYRWLTAREAANPEWEEQAAVAWLQTCYDVDPPEKAMLVEVDPELEIQRVLFGKSENTFEEKAVRHDYPDTDALNGKVAEESCHKSSEPNTGRLPVFLQRRERERQTVTRLAHWYARRYDIVTALQLASQSLKQEREEGQGFGNVLSASWRGVGGFWKDLEWKYRWVLATVTAIVALLGILFLLSKAGAIGGGVFIPFLVAVLLIFAFTAESGGARSRKAQLIVRLVGGCVVGWLPTFADEFIRLASPQAGIVVGDYLFIVSWSYVLPLVAVAATLGYVFLEAKRAVPSISTQRKSIWRRSVGVVGIGLFISATVGALVARFASAPMILDIAREGDFNLATIESGQIIFTVHEVGELPSWLEVFEPFFLDAIFGTGTGIFPTYIWLFYTPIALFIGIFVQLLWEDKPLTEPL